MVSLSSLGWPDPAISHLKLRDFDEQAEVQRKETKAGEQKDEEKQKKRFGSNEPNLVRGKKRKPQNKSYKAKMAANQKSCDL